MKQKKESGSSDNSKIAIIFLIFICLVVVFSLMLKLVLLIQQGHFDEDKRFSISVSDNKSIEVLSFAPNTRSIVIFKLDSNMKFSDTASFLEIPIDGFIKSGSLDLNQNINSLFFNILIKYNKLSTNLTIIDVLRLFIFARTVSEKSVNIKSISQDLSTADIDGIVGRLINDELIAKDSQTIQIINSTDVHGLGQRLARLVTNIGGNVIIVETGESKAESSISYAGQKTYTVDRLAKILNFKTVKIDNKAIADIVVTIGENKLNSIRF